MRHLVWIFLAFLSGCAAMPTLNGTRWKATGIDGQPAASAESTLEFNAGGHAAGRGGCNRIAGSVTVDGASLTFGEMIATRMACPPPQMEQEDRFLKALAEVRSWKREGTTLSLFDAAGNVRVLFEAAP